MSERTLNVLKAFDMARRAHAGQKYGDEDYIWHPYRVALAFDQPRFQIVGMLHDTVEDTDLTLAEIEAFFGAEISQDVDTLTRRKEEEYLSEYIPRVGRFPSARKVKIADLRENIRAALASPQKYRGLLRRYRKALEYLEAVEKSELVGESPFAL